MEWPEKAKRPGDDGTMGAARWKLGDFIGGAGKVAVSAAVGSGPDCGTVWGPKMGWGMASSPSGAPGSGLTSIRSELDAPCGPLVSAVAKLAAGRACIS